MQKQIAIITFLPRSGSTLLAKRLSVFKDIGVTIEGDLLEHNEIENFSLENNHDLDAFLQQLYKRIKFKSWNIDKQILREQLLKNGFPISFEFMLTNLFGLYFKEDGVNVKTYVYKHGYRILDYIEGVWKQIPNAKFIFIDRDPRAIYNSQKVSMDNYKEALMQTDVVQFTKMYIQKQKIIRVNKDKENFHLIKYEELISNEKETSRKILEFLNVSDTISNSNDYYSKIPDKQKNLHKNLNSQNKTERISAWKTELTKSEICFLQYVLKNELQEKEYPFQKIENFNLTERIKFLNYLFRYLKYVVFRNFLFNKSPLLYKCFRVLKHKGQMEYFEYKS